ncbi:NUDIX hydrolase [Mycobacterium sp. SM1]|uniref:NUDIX hydrolase n=1 Tax=Mycobacterium sp. SM1 TaxID=2816243 RepID=UPI001BCAD6B0|nr:NUDIX hydrolase [Mycobacterium sp. SM1]MBS4726941.1 NUDIX hydrolase [Mycobacterium sp. SM1]
MPTETLPGGQRRAGTIIGAAGAVVWRPGSDTAVEVAVIHRPRYDDWSLPKGKVDPGETEPVTVVREVLEETGHHVHLGRRLHRVSYPVEQGIKRVRYWAARSLGGEFTPGREVDDLLWLAVPDAAAKLSYEHDRKVLRRFATIPADTHTLLIVRHGTAGSKKPFSGNDAARPLDKKGRAQAEALVGQLMAFGATEVHAADKVRCHQTVEPLAEELGVTIINEPALTAEAYAENPGRARRRVMQIAGLDDAASEVPRPVGSTPVICTQGEVIPDLIAWWCDRDGVRPDKSRNRKGSTWVLSLHGGRLVAADHLASALPPKTSA